MPPRLTPLATYRIQLGPGFGFREVEGIVPYLDELGISHLYLSPIQRARQGSRHGYDVTDPTRLNPELGTEEDMRYLVRALRSRGMGILLDMVPNHMAATQENPWWWETLEQGRASRYAGVFDIDWDRSGAAGRIALPILGEPYREALAAGRIRVEAARDGFRVRYWEHALPVDPASWPVILETEDSARRRGSRSGGALRRLAAEAMRVPRRSGTAPRRRRHLCDELRAKLRRILDGDPAARRWLRTRVSRLNTSARAERLDRLLQRQAYRLIHWRRAPEALNYRRFFDVDHLVGVRVESPEVFDRTHALVLDLARRGWIQGVRVDHVDGLADPEAYLRRLARKLRAATGSRQTWVVVEKILSGPETLPRRWPVEGTTGYEFGRAAGRLLTDPLGLRALDGIHTSFTGARSSFEELLRYEKERALLDLFPGEVRQLVEALRELERRTAVRGSIPAGDLERALVALTVALPVYRTYSRGGRLSLEDRRLLEGALRDSRVRHPDLGRHALPFLGAVLGIASRTRPLRLPREGRRRFVLRWQQLTGPAEAKGLEDTVLYRFNRLLALNEVGGDPNPAPEALSVRAFHAHNENQRRTAPRGLNATSTHDSKRGEDLRARLHVLSASPGAWGHAARRWARMNRAHRVPGPGAGTPDREDEWFLYQTLAGAWPPGGAGLPDFRKRIEEYAIKAAREAGRRTCWISPDIAYEGALLRFVRAILSPSRSKDFLEDLDRFVKRLAAGGIVLSLAQTVLKATSPGVPDVYQGTELWARTLVDPDNRRPVDFDRRARILGSVGRTARRGRSTLCRRLLEEAENGAVKLYVLARSLALRRESPALFQRGDYLPIQASGPPGPEICAFARRLGSRWAITAVPAGAEAGLSLRRLAAGETPWREAVLRLPPRAPDLWENVFTGERIPVESGRVPLLDGIFNRFPVALLRGLGR